MGCGGSVAPNVPNPDREPNKRALTVGINYAGAANELKGCINDTETMIKIWKSIFEVPAENIKILRDNDNNNMPTKANIMDSFKELVQTSIPGDSIFFHFSGHGVQQNDSAFGGDEADGLDECLVPSDFKECGYIVDDDLIDVIKMVPKGATLFILLDCCHAGNLDLPCVAKVDGGNVTMTEGSGKKFDGKVVLFSACREDQKARDGKVKGKFTGAMTGSFDECMQGNKAATSRQLLVGMQKWMTNKLYSQVPQLAAGSMIDLDMKFVESMKPAAV